MRGPFWNERTGVTGEPNSNYVTVTDTETGETRTLTGEAADAYRATADAQ